MVLNREISEISEYEELEVQAVIMLLLTGLNEYLNTTRPLKESQLEKVAFKIINNFGGLTLEDISICFDRIEDGFYGHIYEGIDGLKIHCFLNQYVAEKFDNLEYLRKKADKERFEPIEPKPTVQSESDKARIESAIKGIYEQCKDKQVKERCLTLFQEYIEIGFKCESLRSELDIFVKKNQPENSYSKSLRLQIDNYDKSLCLIEAQNPEFIEQLSNLKPID